MKAKRLLGVLCIALGVLLLLDALGLHLSNRRESDQAGKAAEEAMAVLQARIEADGSTQPPVSGPLPTEAETPGESIPETGPEETEPIPELTAVAIDGHDYVGYLEIPSLNRKLPVIQLKYVEDLQIAPCLQTGSPYGNNAVIAAHNYPSHFGPLRDFEGGEEIQFTDMNGETIGYTVSVVKTIEPTAVSEVTDSEYDLVLYTCTTGGQARVMLGCERISVIQ